MGEMRDDKADVAPPLNENEIDEESSGTLAVSAELPGDPHEWTAREAMRTRQFLLLILCGVAYAVPWSVATAHGRLHLQDLGFSARMAAAVLSISIGLTIVGRLSGAIGDFIPPHRVLGTALLVESLGMAGFLFATTPTMAYASFALLGLGFGVAYINVAVVFSSYFGRRAFAATAGVRIMITGVFNAIGPWLAGEAFDRYASYSQAFTVLVIVGLCGSVAAFLCPPPGPPTYAASNEW